MRQYTCITRHSFGHEKANLADRASGEPCRSGAPARYFGAQDIAVLLMQADARIRAWKLLRVACPLSLDQAHYRQAERRRGGSI